MPNWIYNSLMLTSKEDFEKLITKDEDGKDTFSFETLIPMPDYIFRGDLGQEEKEKYGENNWYDWSWENWGTKWDACDVEVDRENLQITFNSAWNVPEEILYKVIEVCQDGGEWSYSDEDYDGTTIVMFKDGRITNVLKINEEGGIE